MYMNYNMAVDFINMQRKAIRKANNARFILNGWEYKIAYEGGFSEFVSLYRRIVGKRNFMWYEGFSAWRMRTADEVIEYAKKVAENPHYTKD